MKGDRGAFLEGSLNEKTYAVIDQLEIIANAHDTSVAAASLAWLSAKPGITSPIIGARRLAQLEDNIRALEVKLTADEIAKLDTLTQPELGFPQSMLPMAPAILNGGASINGVFAPASGSVMLKGEKSY